LEGSKGDCVLDIVKIPFPKGIMQGSTDVFYDLDFGKPYRLTTLLDLLLPRANQVAEKLVGAVILSPLFGRRTPVVCIVH
jgi:hypothetical protein